MKTTHRQPPPPLALGIADAAARMGVPPSTVRGWVRTGVLASVRVGGRRLIRVADLDRLLAPSEVAHATG